MPTYAYIVKDPNGSRQEGQLKAPSMDAALEQVQAMGVVITLKEKHATDRAAKQTLGEKIMQAMENLKNRVRLRTLVFFTRQLATMFAAGLTIEKSISNLAVEEKNKKFKSMIEQVSTDVKKGIQLSDALERHPAVFNRLYVALVKAGEISGSLHTVLLELADYLEGVEDTRTKVKSAMYYPVFIFSFLILAVVFLLWKVVPQFEEVYARFGADLPVPTQVLVSISRLISNNIVWAMLVLLLVAFIIWVISLTEKGGFFIDSIFLKMPVFGGLLHDSIMNKYSKTMSILFASGVTVMESLKLAQGVVANKVVERAVANVRDLLKDGYSVSNAMKKSEVFPSTLVQLTATGEETGELDVLLGKAADFYAKQVDSVIERLTSLIEPFMIISIGVVVGAILIVIYLPVFNMGMVMQRGM
jgi:type IV pilus assembly protein PilC